MTIPRIALTAIIWSTWIVCTGYAVWIVASEGMAR